MISSVLYDGTKSSKLRKGTPVTSDVKVSSLGPIGVLEAALVAGGSDTIFLGRSTVTENRPVVTVPVPSVQTTAVALAIEEGVDPGTCRIATVRSFDTGQEG